MQIGRHLPTQGAVATREALMTFCRKAEEHQMASLWVSDHYCAYKALGLRHMALDFRRESLAQMLEVLELVATEVRPAVQAA